MQAVILAGGLSRRLGGVPKAGLMVAGQTLLARTVEAALQLTSTTPGRPEAANAPGTPEAANAPGTPETPDAGPRIAVVGPVDSIATWLGSAALGTKVVAVQESPAFAGPAAGIAAGLAALDRKDGMVLVLACDMPQAPALAVLLQEASRSSPGTAVVAVDEGRLQPLAGIYPVRELQRAADAARASQRLTNASVRALIATVSITECVVPRGLTADIDTWDDARSHGIAMQGDGQD